MTASLFSPITFRGLTLRNRIGVSPMCQYSAKDGLATDWHLVHLGARAVGGAGLVMVEATAVVPEGRITPGCLGLWNDAQEDVLGRIASFIRAQGAVPAIQLAHAGRKAACALPWDGGHQLAMDAGGWQTAGPSPLPFAAGQRLPREMTQEDIIEYKSAFIASARRAVRAGFQIVEIHAAHGYLLHSFLSPLTNRREDAYGGAEENRFRLLLELATETRAALPQDIVLAARLSCSDWMEGGLDIADTTRLSAQLRDAGIDFIDCSSGGLVPDAKVAAAPGYQVPFAENIRRVAGVPVAAVGLITQAQQADDIVRQGQADMVFLARAMLQDAYWPQRAAVELGVAPAVPPQYLRGWPSDALVPPPRRGAA